MTNHTNPTHHANHANPTGPTPTLKLDTGRTPRWDLTLVIRGVEVPTLGPLTAADRSIVNLGARRPGAMVRLWRWAFGDPRSIVADDHETVELRRTVAAFVPHGHQGFLGAMSGGELLAVLGNYVGAQQAWYAQIEREARAEAERVWEAARDSAMPAKDLTGMTIPRSPVGVTHEQRLAAGRRLTTPPMKLVPGQPLPAMAAGLVDDFRDGPVAGGTD